MDKSYQISVMNIALKWDKWPWSPLDNIVSWYLLMKYVLVNH